MSFEGTARGYVQQLVVTIGKCASIARADRDDVPRRSVADGSTWVIARGFMEGELASWPDAAVPPFHLIYGGVLHLYMRIRQVGTKSHPTVEIDAYRIKVEDLAENPNGIGALRYDKTQGMPQFEGWDDDLKDNPHHPHCHLHLNYRELGANDLRLPTGPVSPVLLVATFDHWYYSTCRPSNG
jgi:hypothetical protein